MAVEVNRRLEGYGKKAVIVERWMKEELRERFSVAVFI